VPVLVAGFALATPGAADPQRSSGALDKHGTVPTFAVGVRNVNLDVLVTRGGRPIAGLSAKDFIVTDNGVRQEVEIVAHEDTAVDAILALDTSASVSGKRLVALQLAAHAFVDALWPTDSITLIGFATSLRLAASAGVTRAATHVAIDEFRGSGSTSLIDAIYASLLTSDPRRGRPLVLVFSDGLERGSWLTPEAVRAVARSTDAVIDYVSVGDEPRLFLEDVAEDTGGRGWSARSDRDLREAFVTALEDFKSRYRLRYEPRGVSLPGWHALSVKLDGAKGQVRARRGYQAGTGR
jgi:VWFA-related protein